MVGVVVAGEHPTQVHVVAIEDVKNVGDSVRGVNNYRVAGVPITDEVHEVGHLRGHRIFSGEVTTRKQLTEIEPVTGHSRKRTDVQKIWLIPRHARPLCSLSRASWRQ